MSGEGLVSVRLPRSLLGAFRASTDRQGISIHEAARRVVSFLPSFTLDELKSLTEPPRELDTPRVSLYVGWDALDILASLTGDGVFTTSGIFRRLIYGLVVTKDVEFVQHNEHWKLQIAKRQYCEKTSRGRAEKGPSCA
jgi:hypothetical protein